MNISQHVTSYLIKAGIYLTVWLAFTSCSQKNHKIIPQLEQHQTVQHLDSWQSLDSFPEKSRRNDDVVFINPKQGWAINNSGKAFRTTDGGETWKLKLEKDRSYFRCLAFKDSLNGWIGTIGWDSIRYSWVQDTVVFYETHDGGNNWEPVIFPDNEPTGLCGLQVVSDRLIVGCGRVRGPSYFIRSTDGGETWESHDLNHKAQMLIAPHFFDEKNGILIGGTAFEFEESQALILSTEDGGDSWDTLYVSSQKGEYAWKVSFPSRQVGYVSVQRNVDGGRYYFLKTTDGGKSWKEMDFTTDKYFVQGIGFLNEQVGWIGGDFNYSYETRDGGETWHRIASGKVVNKFWFVNDTLGFASGGSVYRLNDLKSPPNGIVNSFYENGGLKNQSNYTQGILNGKSVSYYRDGSIQAEGKYVNNLRSGIWTHYDENGKMHKLKYRDGLYKLSSKDLEEYTGVYQREDSILIHIYKEGNQLVYKPIKSESKYNIYPEFPDIFFFDISMDVKALFNRVENKHVSHFILDLGGRTIKTVKLSSEESSRILTDMKISEGGVKSE